MSLLIKSVKQQGFKSILMKLDNCLKNIWLKGNLLLTEYMAIAN